MVMLNGVVSVRIMDLIRELEKQRGNCIIIIHDEDTCTNTTIGSLPMHDIPETMAEILEGCAADLREKMPQPLPFIVR